MPYIHFTDEQKLQANAVDLEQFLLQRGERLIPSGREKRLVRDHSVTVRGFAPFAVPQRGLGLQKPFLLSCQKKRFLDSKEKALGVQPFGSPIQRPALR
jgi:hypothetical protein